MSSSFKWLVINDNNVEFYKFIALVVDGRHRWIDAVNKIDMFIMLKPGYMFVEPDSHWLPI